MKYLSFYKERIPNLGEPNVKGEATGPCIFHAPAGGWKDASNPTLSVNVEKGSYRCHVSICPAHDGGGYKKFDKLLKGEVTGTNIHVKPIDRNALDGFHSVLLATSAAMDVLHKHRGLTDATIKKFKLGWDGSRILIPIEGPDGSIVNVRKYKYGAAKDKMIAWDVGYNRARLFPIENTKGQRVILFEGETDCLLACQNGYPAVTATGGADTWLEEFNDMLKGKDVFICYDADAPGKTGASKVAQKLLPFAESVRVIKLPLSGSKDEKDYTNYALNLGHPNADFDKLIDAAELIVPMVETAAPPDDITPLHLSAIGEDIYVGKRVQSTVLIAGKDLAPFQVPYRIGFQCDQVGSEKQCERCGIAKANGSREVKLPEWSPDILKMVNVTSERLDMVVGEIGGVPNRCPKFKHEVKEYANVESVKAIPEIDFSAENAEYVIRSLFFLGNSLQTNHTYRIDAVVMPDPKTQYATALVYNAVPAQDSIEKFVLTPEMAASLKLFQVCA